LTSFFKELRNRKKMLKRDQALKIAEENK